MSLTGKLRTRLHRWQFERAVAGILTTPPLAAGRRQLIALSMVHHRDVLPYLLAVKSFARHAEPCRVVMVADPTIDARDRETIRAHVPFVELRDAREFQRDGIPVGGTWERLSAIAEHVREAFVVQLDADTVTIGPVPEVVDAVEHGRAFALPTDDYFSDPWTCAAISDWARARASPDAHIQIVAESLMDRLPQDTLSHYVRGCSGFAGFPRNSFDFARLRLVSDHMSRLLGERWREWGSEQVASNLIVANIPGGRLLPHARYCAPHRRREGTAFLHFIGYVRFTTGLYAQLARDIVASESAASRPLATAS